MCDFKPGGEVVCVDDEGGEHLRIGAVYTVAEYLPAGEGHGDWVTGLDCVQLVEVGHFENEDEYGFAAVCFRKVQRRDLTAWLATENTIEDPKRVKVPAMGVVKRSYNRYGL